MYEDEYDDEEDEVSDSLLIDVYLPAPDEEAIRFIKSKECTVRMVNYDNGDGISPLMYAAYVGRYKVVEALLEKGANVNHICWDTTYNTLQYCIIKADPDGRNIENELKVMDLLISAGIDLNYGKKHSAFTLACDSGLNYVIGKLLQHSIDLTFKDESGNTGLAYLSIDQNKEGLRMVNSYMLRKDLEENLKLADKPSKKVKV